MIATWRQAMEETMRSKWFGTALILIFLISTSPVLKPVTAQDPPQPPPSRPVQPEKGEKQGPPRAGAQADTQPQDPTSEAIKINTELVLLDVTVIDQNNNPVFDLKKDDFTVFEDKIKQEIEDISRAEVSISFGLVIDTSGSMRSKLQTVSDAALNLIKQMRQDDEGFVAQFKVEPELIQDFTRDRRELEEALGEMYTSGGTALLDAIIAGADYAQEKGKQRRKAIVVITDGLEKNSSVKEREVMEAIKEDEVQVYLVGFIDDDESSSLFGRSPAKKAKELLNRLAEDSGGRAFFPKDVSEMPAIAAQIAKDMRTQYVVSYYPTNQARDGKFRTVRVVVNPSGPSANRKLIARTRQGYYAKGDRGPAQAVNDKKTK
jgi:Ca-activated chloride channel family protein